MSTLLRVEHLQKTYRGHWLIDSTRALEDVSFEVSTGETVGLLGPNGAGKTTTFKAVTGLIRPSSGRVELFGRPPRDPRARERLGFLPENAYFYDFLTGEEFVDLAARLAGVPSSVRAGRVRETMDRSGLGDARRRRIRTYSKGMKQRVGIAQALVAEPALVILDEPMTGLDPIGRREVRDVIGSLADEGTGVIFSTHVLQDVELTCDRVVILAAGRVLRTGGLDELLADVEGSVEITVRGIEAETLATLAGESGAEMVGAGGRRHVLRAADAERAERLRSALVAAGGEVLAVSPQPPRLEDAFLREIAASRRELP